MSHHYHFNITMTCGGCSGAVDRVLKKLEGIESYQVSLETQTADVHTKADADLSYATVLEKIKKTGKKVNSAEVDDQPASVEDQPAVVEDKTAAENQQPASVGDN